MAKSIHLTINNGKTGASKSIPIIDSDHIEISIDGEVIYRGKDYVNPPTAAVARAIRLKLAERKAALRRS